MALHRSDLPQEVQDKLAELLKKEIVELSLSDRVFLQARRDYLNAEEQDRFSDILTEKAIANDGPKLQKLQRQSEQKLGVGEFRGAEPTPQEAATEEPTPKEEPKKEAKAKK